LRQALERGASDEEIKRLTDQLRAALDKFLQALAEQLRKNPQQLARPLDPNARMLRPQDLKSMIDRLEQMARSGAKDAAKRLLQELRKRGFGQKGQQGQGEMDQFGQAGEAMGEAEGQLGQGNADGAVDSQGRALEALRRGAQNLAQSMQQQGMMMGPGPNGQP